MGDAPPPKDARPYAYGEGGLGATAGTGGQQYEMCLLLLFVGDYLSVVCVGFINKKYSCEW